MDSAQWNQEFGVTSSIPCTPPRPVARPPKDQTLNCPRCHSTNTKFCYYNNYSLTQPRYLCKTCRRYWTAGGSLRNVPVGGGSRKHNKKYISTTPSDHHINSHPPVLPHHHQNPKIHDQGQDLNLGSGVPHFLKFPKIEGKDVIPSSSSSSTISSANATHLSTPNFMRSGNNFNVDRGPYNNSLVPTMVPISSGISSLDHHRQTNYALFPPPGFSFQECKPPLASFNVSGYTNSSEPEEDVNGTLMFTLGTTKRHSGTGEGGDHNHQDKGSLENNSNGFWNGVLGGGGSW